VTLPHCRFAQKVQITLIGGPHGNPFHDMEFHHFYPTMHTGGVLLVYDIKIPSIKRMFDIIDADDMFDLVEIVGYNLEIYKRTNFPSLIPKAIAGGCGVQSGALRACAVLHARRIPGNAESHRAPCAEAAQKVDAGEHETDASKNDVDRN
jgi:hypothetical protein